MWQNYGGRMSQLVSSDMLAAIRETVNRCSHTGERYQLEFSALLAGLKKVVRVQVENDGEYEALCHFATLGELSIAHSPTRMKVAWTNSLGDTFLTAVPWDDPEGTSYAAYLAKHQHDADQAAIVESEGTAEEIGQLLGYPSCCCIAYARLEDGEFWAPVLAEHSPEAHHAPWANRYAYLLYGASLFPDYFPCSLDCKGTEILSQSFYRMALTTDLRKTADQYLALMRRPIIIGAGFLLGLAREDDAASVRFPSSVMHEWQAGASAALPAHEEIEQALRERRETLALLDGSQARIMYLDR